MNHADLFSLVSPTYLENWPTGLYALSIPHVAIPLSTDQVQLLYQCNRTFRSATGFQEHLHTLRQSLQQVMADFSEGVFVRLGSRSAKDSFFAISRGLRVSTADEAIAMISSGSAGLAHDLLLAMHCHYQPYLFVRAWIDIPAWAEFRCFVRTSQLVGISQYDPAGVGHHPNIGKQANGIDAAIRAFFSQFQQVAVFSDIVFDVYIYDADPTGRLPVRLLELNPFHPNTDSCLFDWNKPGDFDGSFRYV